MPPDHVPGSVWTRHPDVNDPGRRRAWRPRPVQGSFTSVCRLIGDEPGEQHANRRVFCTTAGRESGRKRTSFLQRNCTRDHVHSRVSFRAHVGG